MVQRIGVISCWSGWEGEGWSVTFGVSSRRVRRERVRTPSARDGGAGRRRLGRCWGPYSQGAPMPSPAAQYVSRPVSTSRHRNTRACCRRQAPPIWSRGDCWRTRANRRLSGGPPPSRPRSPTTQAGLRAPRAGTASRPAAASRGHAGYGQHYVRATTSTTRPARIGTTHLGGCPQAVQIGVCTSCPRPRASGLGAPEHVCAPVPLRERGQGSSLAHRAPTSRDPSG